MTTKQHLGILDFHKVTVETDSIYQKLQKHSGLSDAEFWSFVAIRLDNCKHQHEICNSMLMSKQTVHTALKGLVKKGFIIQTLSEENQRLKCITLTDIGIKFANHYVDIVRPIEQEAWSQLSSSERQTLLKLCRKLNNYLDSEVENFIQTNK